MLNVFGRGFDQTRVAFARKGKVKTGLTSVKPDGIWQMPW